MLSDGFLLALLCSATLVHPAQGQDPGPDQGVGEDGRQDDRPSPRQRPKQEDGAIVVTASRQPESSFDSPRAHEVLDEHRLRIERQVRTVPEAFKESPGVSVQKTGHSQGSPKIRGMNGYLTLFLIDGIRLNNSTWRSGNVEYWSTVDSYSLRMLEMVRGPGSVLYGTDAVGGTVQGFTLDPEAWVLDDRKWPARRVLLRYASAERGWNARVEGGLPLPGDGLHYGVTWRNYDDMVAGKELGELPYTGYHEVDVDLKYRVDLGPGKLSLGYQHVDQPDPKRTHSTVFSKPWRGIVPGSDFAREPAQRRDLGLAQWEGPVELGVADELWASLSYQRFDEEQDRTTSNSRRRIEGVLVDQYGIQARLIKELDGWSLTYGFEVYLEDVGSSFTEYNPDGSLRTVRPRGPVADDSSYDQFGVYAEAMLPIGGDWDLRLGLRYNHFRARANQVDPTGSSGFGPIDDSWDAVVGSVHATWKVDREWRVFGGIAQSFRAPNLSDLTRFDIALSGDLEIPSPNLDPERYLTFELGTRFDDGSRSFEVDGYFTDGHDLIRRQPTGNMPGGLVEVTKANIGQGYYTGFEALGAVVLDFVDLHEWELYGFADSVWGLEDASDPADPRRVRPKGLPPASGQLGLRWRRPDGGASFETYGRFVAGIDASDYNAAEARNTQRIPPDGLPGVAIFGVRGSYRFCDGLIGSLGIENIANQDWRIFDSGQNELGTNVILTLEATF